MGLLLILVTRPASYSRASSGLEKNHSSRICHSYDSRNILFLINCLFRSGVYGYRIHKGIYVIYEFYKFHTHELL